MAWDDLGSYRHVVHLANPGTPMPAPDGEGGYIETWTPCNPEIMHASIEVAAAGDQERADLSTVLSQATHVVRLRFHPEVTTKTRLTVAGRVFNVTGVRNIDERAQRMVLLCAEVIQ